VRAAHAVADHHHVLALGDLCLGYFIDVGHGLAKAAIPGCVDHGI
jgi:hypothetical protein